MTEAMTELHSVPAAVAASGRKRRRSPGVNRTLLLDAARELFPARGYANVSCRDVADLAGTSETQVFRLFGTKAKLFEEALLTPLVDFVNNFVAEWEDRPTRQVELIPQAFFSGLYDLLSENRGTILALQTAHLYDGVGPVGRDSPLSVINDKIAEFTARILDEPDIDHAIWARLMFGMVVGMAVLDEWLFPAGRRPSNTKIVQEFWKMLAHDWTATIERHHAGT